MAPRRAPPTASATTRRSTMVLPTALLLPTAAHRHRRPAPGPDAPPNLSAALTPPRRRCRCPLGLRRLHRRRHPLPRRRPPLPSRPALPPERRLRLLRRQVPAPTGVPLCTPPAASTRRPALARSRPTGTARLPQRPRRTGPIDRAEPHRRRP